MFEAILFDIDGTLLDSNDVHAHTWREAFSEFGKEIPADKIRESIGKGGDNLLPDFLSREEIESFGEALKHRRGEIAETKYLHLLRPFTMVRELGISLKERGVTVGVATSAEEKELKVILDLIRFADLIEVKSSSADAKSSKPDPDIFVAALEQLGYPDLSSVLVVGDSPYDVTAAKRAGLKCVGVLCGGFSKEQLMGEGAVAVFRSPADLLFRLDELLGVGN